ncbi:hypothetical protein PybrP1_001883 [[Pythium] brassicae (nom. inval.)]|nr:hypothetical protein PybrP1_001883 [[Pythium] brassicae (nom. inval.)]
MAAESSSLDDEFARFEAELRSLEQQQPTADAAASENADASKKRSRGDAAAEAADEPSRKRAELTAAPVVVRAAPPTVYMAPPRPAPVKKAFEPAAPAPVTSTYAASAPAASAPPFRPGVANTVEEVAARRSALTGALSGFPPGTTGAYAAAAPPRLPAPQTIALPRFDMATGQYISAEEQQMVNQQQSVYEYDPNKPLTTTNPSVGVDTATSTGASGSGGAATQKPKRMLRVAGGELWEDKTLEDWPANDFRLFCGDLGNEVSDEVLAHSFSRFASFQRARVVRDKFTHKSRGYGFVSFADPFECAKALREMNGKYIGNRPVKITKSKWQDRNMDVAKKKGKKKNRHLFT